MALQLSTTQFGYDFTESDLRINQVAASKTTGINVMFVVFADANAAIAQAVSISGGSHHFDFEETIEGSNPIENGYYLLKTLEEFSTAIDV